MLWRLIAAARAGAALFLIVCEEGLAIHMAAAEEGGVLLSSMLAMARTGTMPLSPAVQKAGQAFLDPARFKAGGTGKARLARIAQNLDRMEQARSLWREALAGGHRPEPGQLDPTLTLARDASVRGLVQVDARPAAGLRVGLLGLRILPSPLSLPQANPV